MGLLVVFAFWRSDTVGLSLILLANLALVGGVTWYFAAMALTYRRKEAAGAAVVVELGLAPDYAGEVGNGGYPCENVWQCYRGLLDGAEITWLKVWVGSSRRGGTVWIASTKISPPFAQEFRIDASYAAKPVPAPHPRLPANREIWWEPRDWVATWLDSLPEATAAALHAFLSEDRRTVVTGRVVFCFVPELGLDGAPAAHAAFREITALARRLRDSAEA